MSKAFFVIKNTTDVDVLVLKLKVMCPAAPYIEMPCYNRRENQTLLHLVSSFSQRDFGLVVG
jgi:hypothetical protein